MAFNSFAVINGDLTQIDLPNRQTHVQDLGDASRNSSGD